VCLPGFIVLPTVFRRKFLVGGGALIRVFLDWFLGLASCARTQNLQHNDGYTLRSITVTERRERTAGALQRSQFPQPAESLMNLPTQAEHRCSVTLCEDCSNPSRLQMEG
jgi:hypothetical protein